MNREENVFDITFIVIKRIISLVASDNIKFASNNIKGIILLFPWVASNNINIKIASNDIIRTNDIIPSIIGSVVDNNNFIAVDSATVAFVIIVSKNVKCIIVDPVTVWFFINSDFDKTKTFIIDPVSVIFIIIAVGNFITVSVILLLKWEIPVLISKAFITGDSFSSSWNTAVRTFDIFSSYEDHRWYINWWGEIIIIDGEILNERQLMNRNYWWHRWWEF